MSVSHSHGTYSNQFGSFVESSGASNYHDFSSSLAGEESINVDDVLNHDLS